MSIVPNYKFPAVRRIAGNSCLKTTGQTGLGVGIGQVTMFTRRLKGCIVLCFLVLREIFNSKHRWLRWLRWMNRRLLSGLL